MSTLLVWIICLCYKMKGIGFMPNSLTWRAEQGFFFLPQLTKKLHNTFNAPETPLLIPSNTAEAVIKTTWPNCYGEVEEP